MNAGGIRNAIMPGIITYSDLVFTQPFENTWDTIELQGEDLLQVCNIKNLTNLLLQAFYFYQAEKNHCN